jgi:hypothetical protein
MHNSDATGKVRRLRGEERVACRLSDQIVDGSTVSGTSSRFAKRLRQRNSLPAARDINEAINSEWPESSSSPAVKVSHPRTPQSYAG